MDCVNVNIDNAGTCVVNAWDHLSKNAKGGEAPRNVIYG